MAQPTTTNVVRLPTAARRKVQQHMNAGARAARKALREETPWPGEFIFAGVREAMKTAELLADLKPSAELQLLTAICAALDDPARAKVIDTLAPAAASGQRPAKQALAVLRSTRMTYGEMNDLDNAWRRLTTPKGRV